MLNLKWPKAETNKGKIPEREIFMGSGAAISVNFPLGKWAADLCPWYDTVRRTPCLFGTIAILWVSYRIVWGLMLLGYNKSFADEFFEAI